MGMNSRASLFYGILINEDDAKKLIKKFSSELKENVEDLEDLEDYDEGIDEVMELLASLKGFEIVWCSHTFSDDPSQYGIAVYEKRSYDWEETKKFKMPDEEKLNEKWAKIAEKLNLGKRKPGWYLFTEFS